MDEHRVPLTARDEGAGERGSVQFIGTATTLIRFGGFTILTDPNFLHAGDHAHLGYGLTARRLTDPALEIEDLPPVDLCILSHFHGDHWDRVATERLPRTLRIVTTPQAARALGRRGFHVTHPLRRWGAINFTKSGRKLRITAMPGQHGPAVVSRLLPDVMGSMLEWTGPGEEAPRFRLYISGDTLVHDELRRIPERYPHVDLGLFHLGGTRVIGVLVTMDAEQSVQALQIVRPDLAIPIHYDDYPVFKSPLADFARAVADAGLSDRVEYLQRGETYEFRFDRPGRTVEVAPQPRQGLRIEPPDAWGDLGDPRGL